MCEFHDKSSEFIARLVVASLAGAGAWVEYASAAYKHSLVS